MAEDTGMYTKRGFRALCLGAAVLSLSLMASAQGTERYKGRLSPVPVDTGMLDTVKGSGSVTAELVGSKLTISGTFSGLATPATIAQLHQGPNVGIRGPEIGDLTVTKATSGSVSGTIELKPLQLGQFKKGFFYVQIHSEKAPDGNLWGWLMPDTGRK
jgi:hypothetical protein